jgi:CBS domain-containing protein
MLVREIMTTDVVTVPDATLRAAIGELLAAGVGSVVVVDDDDTPAGFVTETDALRALYDRGDPPQDVAVRDLAHPPVVTTDPDRTVQHVAERMAEEGVKKVLVTEDLDIVGIATLTDIVWHLGDIRREVAVVADRDWGPQD